MIKRILAFTLMLTMLISLFCVTSMVSAAKNNYDVIKALGLIKNFPTEHKNPSDRPTRAELAAVAVTMVHPSMSYEIEKMYFEDVPLDYWALKHIELAASINIMRGYGRTFEPEGQISFIEAVVTMVRVAGYEHIAQARGGYPTGYMLVANERGISRGMGISNDAKINFADLSTLIINTLDVDVMLMTGIGDSIRFGSTPGKTVLTECLSHIKVRGILTENDITSLAGISSLPENHVVISEKRYNAGTTNAASYLGYDILAYAKYDEITEKSTIVYIESNNTTEFYIDAEDIESATKTQITYEINDRIRELKIPERIYVIYNNIYIDSWDENDLMPESGKLKFIDNNGDGVYDIVFIETYENYVVDSVNVNTFTIHDKYSLPPLVLDDRGGDLIFTISFGSEKLKISDLQQWDILTVISTKNEVGKRVVEAYLTRDSFSGTIAELDEDGVIVGEQYYKLSASLKAMIETGKMKLSAGSIGIFYTDKFGNLSAFMDSQSGGPGNTNQYGYLYQATGNKGIATGARFKIITNEAKIVIFEGAKRISFSDGMTEKILPSEDYLQAPSFSTDQVIMYSLNELGEIKTMIFPIYGRDDSRFSIDGIFDNKTEKAPQNVIVTRATAGSFSVNDIYYNIDTERTLILAIPKVAAGEEIQENQIEILEADRLPQYESKDESGKYATDNYYLDGLAIDLDETDTAGMILIKKPDWAGRSRWTQHTNHFIVSGVKEVVGEDGEIEPRVSGFFDGSDSVFPVEDESDIALDFRTLKVGDILQVMLNTDRTKIINARRVFTLSDRPTDGTADENCIYQNTGGVKALNQTGRGPMYSECFIGLVDVISYIEKNFKASFVYEGTMITYPYTLMSYTKITIIDLQGNTTRVYMGSEKDIGVGTPIYINSRDTHLRDVVVIRR